MVEGVAVEGLGIQGKEGVWIDWLSRRTLQIVAQVR